MSPGTAENHVADQYCRTAPYDHMYEWLIPLAASQLSMGRREHRGRYAAPFCVSETLRGETAYSSIATLFGTLKGKDGGELPGASLSGASQRRATLQQSLRYAW